MSGSLKALRPGSRVLIAGAGPAGAAVARALQTFGVETLIVEQRDRLAATDGAGVLLPANATAMLNALGHFEALREHACDIPGLCLMSPDGNQLGRVACDDLQYPTWGIRYSRLRDELLTGVAVKYGLSVSSVTETERLQITLSDGSEHLCDMLVGADGVHSTVRSLCIDHSPAELFEQYCGYRFVIDGDLGMNTATTYLGDGLTLLFVPLADRQTYCGAGPVHRDKWLEEETPVETIARSFSAFPKAADALQACDENTVFIPSQFWQVSASVWHRGRVVLLGDAAHATTPTLSQGTAMALEDVAVLIAELKRNETVTGALDNYQQRRESRVKFVQQESARRILANSTTDSRAGRLQRFSSAAFGAGGIHHVWSKLVTDEVVSRKELS